MTNIAPGLLARLCGDQKIIKSVPFLQHSANFRLLEQFEKSRSKFHWHSHDKRFGGAGQGITLPIVRSIEHNIAGLGVRSTF